MSTSQLATDPSITQESEAPSGLLHAPILSLLSSSAAMPAAHRSFPSIALDRRALLHIVQAVIWVPAGRCEEAGAQRSLRAADAGALPAPGHPGQLRGR